ncbi:MAG: long-chain fatty acid--CoA ligase [Deltaproteobacteria bacterium]|nr:long-chain fatty acid--CoA ligase [Deltaproteobacteria bacterium]
MERRNLASMIEDSAERFGERKAMRFRGHSGWQYFTYGEVIKKIKALAASMMELGVQRGDRIGIFSNNCPEWAIADFAILSLGAISVPIYATNTAAQARFIIDDGELGLIFAGSRDHYEKLSPMKGEGESLRRIILFDSNTEGDDRVLSFQDLLTGGQNDAAAQEAVNAQIREGGTDDVATIIYTSGTTGDPKGVMLTHGNFFHQFEAVDSSFSVGAEDRSLCFLPLSHVYERCWSYYIFRRGAENAYISDPKTIVETLREVQPTVMVSVPRLYEKVYAAVTQRAEISSTMRKKLFNWAIRTGKEWEYGIRQKQSMAPTDKIKHSIADRLVLSKIRAVMGGPKNFLSAGGAPLAREIEEFFFAAGMLVCQGYGLTETSPMITFNTPGSFRFGTVGKPVPGCEVKIGANGEVLTRGPNVMKGYYKKPEETKAVFDGEWLKTGDVGEIDVDGFLKITDRIKDLIITSGGKNVAPQYVEMILSRDMFIEQIVVVGDKRKCLGALIVPAFSALENYVSEQGIAYSSRDELVNNPTVKEFFKKRIDENSFDLANYERVKVFSILPREFEQASGEITPTLKMKRRIITERYGKIIDAMYESAGE